VKVFATEMAQDVVDNAMQAHGAMGMTKEAALQLMAQQVRVMRVYEGERSASHGDRAARLKSG
jgi:acyl-CoA dehydrogenase